MKSRIKLMILSTVFHRLNNLKCLFNKFNDVTICCTKSTKQYIIEKKIKLIKTNCKLLL